MQSCRGRSMFELPSRRSPVAGDPGGPDRSSDPGLDPDDAGRTRTPASRARTRRTHDTEGASLDALAMHLVRSAGSPWLLLAARHHGLRVHDLRRRDGGVRSVAATKDM